MGGLQKPTMAPKGHVGSLARRCTGCPSAPLGACVCSQHKRSRPLAAGRYRSWSGSRGGWKHLDVHARPGANRARVWWSILRPDRRPPTVPGSDGLAVVQFFHGDGHVQLAALEAVEATVLTTWIARPWWFGLLQAPIGARRGPIGPLGGGLRRCVAHGCTLR